MPLDLYSTRAQLKAVELLPRNYSVLADFFAADMGVVEDEKAIWDFRKGSQKMAPFVHANTGDVVMPRDGFVTNEVGFCTIAPSRVIENNDLRGRSFGENVLGAMTPEEREKRMIARDLMDMKAAIQLRREWMVRQVLLTGKLSIFEYTNEGRSINATAVADYNFTNIYTPDTPWDQAGAKIEDDMEAIFDMVYDGLGIVDRIVMAPDVAAAMRGNADYVKQFDYKNINMGEINQKYKGQGLRFIGWNADGVEMWSCSGKFQDDDGLMKPIIPNGKLIAGSGNILNLLHGPVTQIEEPGMNAQHKTYMKKEVPLRYASVDSNTLKNRLTSCPTVVPPNVDAWAVANVL